MLAETLKGRDPPHITSSELATIVHCLAHTPYNQMIITKAPNDDEQLLFHRNSCLMSISRSPCTIKDLPKP